MPKLTDKFIKATKGTGKDQFWGDGAGLYLRVSPTGSRVWVYRYKDSTGKTHWLDIGAYPSTSLSEARAHAAALKVKRRNGIDPTVERASNQAEKLAIEAAKTSKITEMNARMTVHSLFDRWMSLEISKRKDKGAETCRMFNKDILPSLGGMAVADVKKLDIAKIIDIVQSRGGEGRMAAMTLAGMRQMFRFAVERDVIESEPTATIRKSRIHKAVERDRVLTKDEIGLLVEKLPASGLNESGQLAVYAMLATCCRVSELSQANTADLNLTAKSWRIPVENTKNKKEHIVALSPFALEIFRKLLDRSDLFGGQWLMPAMHKPGPVNEKTLTKQIGDRQRPGLAPIQGRSALTEALVLPGGKWTAHDLRRTGATLMSEIGVRPDVIDKCLNHTEQNKMKRIYQRHDYKDEMQAAWRLLGTKLERLTNQRLSAPVAGRTTPKRK